MSRLASGSYSSSSSSSTLPECSLHVHFLGLKYHGQTILVETGDRYCFQDIGSDLPSKEWPFVKSFLTERQYSVPRGCFPSSTDRDHFGLLHPLLEDIADVAPEDFVVYLPPYLPDHEIAVTKVRDIATLYNIKIFDLKPDGAVVDLTLVGGQKATLIPPQLKNMKENDSNSRTVVAVIKTKCNAICVLWGDAPRVMQNSICQDFSEILKRVDVSTMPHHGSTIDISHEAIAQVRRMMLTFGLLLISYFHSFNPRT